jgi:hypothetical protein
MDSKDLLERVRALLAPAPNRVAEFELADGEKDPITALYRVLTDEVDRTAKDKADAEAQIEAQRKAVETRLGATAGESLTDALDRVMALAKLGEGARDRLVDELLAQMTRAGIEYEATAQRAIAQRLSPEEIEAQTKMFKAAADARYSAGTVSDPTAGPRPSAGARRPNPALVG